MARAHELPSSFTLAALRGVTASPDRTLYGLSFNPADGGPPVRIGLAEADAAVLVETLGNTLSRTCGFKATFCPCEDNDGQWCSLPGCPHPLPGSLPSATSDRQEMAAAIRNASLLVAQTITTAVHDDPIRCARVIQEAANALQALEALNTSVFDMPLPPMRRAPRGSESAATVAGGAS